MKYPYSVKPYYYVSHTAFENQICIFTSEHRQGEHMVDWGKGISGCIINMVVGNLNSRPHPISG